MRDTIDVAGGHRARLRARFLHNGLSGFHDYEILELLLTFVIPRRDVKPLAKALIVRFGSLTGVFDASVTDLQGVPGVGPRAATLIRFLHEGASAYLKERMRRCDSLHSAAEVVAYCRHRLSGLRYEVFEVIHLDTKNRVLEAETLHQGTIDQTVVYPRRVIEAALRQNAAALIFVHNHPSGNPVPSRADRELTESLVAAAQTVDMAVHDHLIIGKGGYFSFREQGWLSGGRRT